MALARAKSIKGRLARILKGDGKKKGVAKPSVKLTKKAKTESAKPRKLTVRDRIQQEKILTGGLGIRARASAGRAAKKTAKKARISAKAATAVRKKARRR